MNNGLKCAANTGHLALIVVHSATLLPGFSFQVCKKELVEARNVCVVCRSGDCKGCPVEGTPFTPSGQFRPVTLNACKCTMSALAAKSSAENRKCRLCFKALKTDSGFTENEKVRVRMHACRTCAVYTAAVYFILSWDLCWFIRVLKQTVLIITSFRRTTAIDVIVGCAEYNC